MTDAHDDRDDEPTGDESPEPEDAGDTETVHFVTMWGVRRELREDTAPVEPEHR